MTDARQPLPAARADRFVVWLSGEHDIATVPELSGVLADAVAHDDGDLVVDLGEVRFLDASTIRALLHSRDALRLQSRSLTVRTTGRTARLLVLLGLSDMLEPGTLVDTSREADPARDQPGTS